MTYILVEKGNTRQYNCIENCVYEDKQNPGPRFCFKTGVHPVTCKREHGKIFQDKLTVVQLFQGYKCGVKKSSRIFGGQEAEVK